MLLFTKFQTDYRINDQIEQQKTPYGKYVQYEAKTLTIKFVQMKRRILKCIKQVVHQAHVWRSHCCCGGGTPMDMITWSPETWRVLSLGLIYSLSFNINSFPKAKPSPTVSSSSSGPKIIGWVFILFRDHFGERLDHRIKYSWEEIKFINKSCAHIFYVFYIL